MTDCPPSEPANQTSCNAQGVHCDYGADQCVCRFNGWRCSACPDTPPMGACFGGPGENCAYGGLDCSCVNGQWSCSNCPATLPADQSNCSQPGLNCNYTTENCVCGPGGHWRCATPCPPSVPTPGDSCSGLSQCTYGNTFCVCFQGQYLCN